MEDLAYLDKRAAMKPAARSAGSAVETPANETSVATPTMGTKAAVLTLASRSNMTRALKVRDKLKKKKMVHDVIIEPIANTLTKRVTPGLEKEHSRPRSIVHAHPVDTLQLANFVNVDNIPSSPLNITEAYVSGNHLRSLKHLSHFRNLKTVLASHNFLEFLCPDEATPDADKYFEQPLFFTRNTWPRRMTWLITLDVSYNRLTSLPGLHTMPCLRILKARHNRLREPLDTLQHGAKLEIVDLRENSLSWTPQEFLEDCKFFACCKSLRVLCLSMNPFVKYLPDYAMLVAKTVAYEHSPLVRIDDTMMSLQFFHDAVKFELTEEQIQIGLVLAEAKSGLHGENDHDERGDAGDADDIISNSIAEKSVHSHNHMHFDGVPKMQQLFDIIEQCFHSPSRMVDFVHAIDVILTKREEHELIAYGFTEVDLNHIQSSAERARHVHQRMDYMLTRVHILLDRQPRVQDLCLEGIAKLIGVTHFGIGDKCLAFLDYLLQSDDDRHHAVMKQLESSFVPLIVSTISSNDESLELRLTWLNSLAKLSLSTSGEAIVKLLGHLVNPVIKWLTEENMSFGEEILAIIAAICKDPKNAMKLAESDVRVMVLGQMKKMPEGSREHLNILRSITAMAEFHVSVSMSSKSGKARHVSANFFCQDHDVHRYVLGILQRTLAATKHGTPYSAAINEHIEVMLMCISSLLHSHYGATNLLVAQYNTTGSAAERMSTFMKCLQTIWEDGKSVSAHVSPGTMTSLLHCVNTMLRLHESWFPLGGSLYNRDLLEAQISVVLDNVVPILGYLDERKTNQFQRMALRAAAHMSGKQKELKIRMNQVTNPIMHRLIVSVLHVVSWYCSEGSSARARPHVVGILTKLDENNRDALVFGCLACPADEVRLAAVRCLNEVPMDQLGEEEIRILVKSIQERRNISMGDAEVIISDAYSLLTKLTLSANLPGKLFRGETIIDVKEDAREGTIDTEEDEDDTSSSKAKNSQVIDIDTTQANSTIAIITALNILVQNSDRDTGDDRDEGLQKLELSNSMIYFLIAVSATILKSQLGSVSICAYMCKSLYYEDVHNTRYVSQPKNANELSRKHYIPCPVELTWTGRQVGYLLDAINGTYGKRPLNPNGVVCHRIIRRIADIIMDLPDPTLEDLRGGKTKQSARPDEYGVANRRLGTRTRAFHMAFGISKIEDDHAFESASSSDDSVDSEVDEDSDEHNERRRESIHYIASQELHELAMEADLENWWIYSWPLKKGIYQDKPESSHVHNQIRYFDAFDGLKEILRFTLVNCPTPDVIEEDDVITFADEYFSNRSNHVNNREVAFDDEANATATTHQGSGTTLLLQFLMFKLPTSADQYIVGDRVVNVEYVHHEKDDTKTHNAKPPDPSVCEENAIRLAPLLRLLFALVTFTGQIERRKKLTKTLTAGSYLFKLANQVTGFQLHSPLWYHHNVGAKFAALMCECIRLMPDSVTEVPRELRHYALAFEFWEHVIQHHRLDPIGFEEEAILYHASHGVQIVYNQLLAMERPHSSVCETFDFNAVVRFIQLWMSMGNFECMIAILSRVVLYWRDHAEHHSHHSHRRHEYRHRRRFLLVDSLVDIVSSTIVYASGQRRHDLLAVISRVSAEAVSSIPETMVQEILTCVEWKLHNLKVIESLRDREVIDASDKERVYLCFPVRITCSAKSLLFTNGHFIITSRRLYFYYTSALGSQNTINVDFERVKGLALHQLHDRLCLESDEGFIVYIFFMRRAMCTQAFSEAGRYCHFHQQKSRQIPSVLLQEDDICLQALEEIVLRLTEDNAGIPVSKTIACLARVQWFDPENDGKYIGERILCLTKTHFIVLIDCFEKWKPHFDIDGAEEAKSAGSVFEIFKCHSMASVVDFANDDKAEAAAVYVGFENVKKTDRALQLTRHKEDSGGEYIYSEAHYRYSFSFQEYGGNGYIEAVRCFHDHLGEF